MIKLNENWLLILQIVKYLEQSKYSLNVGRILFQKICYVLTRFGTNTGLNFVKGTYGPYSSDIKKMITILSNNNLIFEKELGNMILISVSESFKINSSQYSQEDKNNVNRTFDLFRRIKDTNQAELITTILFSYDELNKEYSTITEIFLFDYIVEWKNRYNQPDIELQIRELTKSLTSLKLINIDYTHDYKESSL